MRIWIVIVCVVGVAVGGWAREVPPSDAGYVVIMDGASVLELVQGVCHATGLWWSVSDGGIEVGNRSDERKALLVRHYRVSRAFARCVDAFDGAEDGKASEVKKFMETIGYWPEGYVKPKARFSFSVKERLLRCEGSRDAHQQLSWVLLAFDRDCPSVILEPRAAPGDLRLLVAEEDWPTIRRLQRAKIAEFAIAGEPVRAGVTKMRQAITRIDGMAEFEIRLIWSPEQPSYGYSHLPVSEITDQQRAETKRLKAKLGPDPFGASDLADPFETDAFDGENGSPKELVIEEIDGRFADSPIRSAWAADVWVLDDAKTASDYARKIARSVSYRLRVVEETVHLFPYGTWCKMGRCYEPIVVNDSFAEDVGMEQAAIHSYLKTRGIEFDDGDFVRYLPHLKTLVFFMDLAKLEQVEQALLAAGVLAPKPERHPSIWPKGWNAVSAGDYPSENTSMAESLFWLRGQWRKQPLPRPPLKLVWTSYP